MKNKNKLVIFVFSLFVAICLYKNKSKNNVCNEHWDYIFLDSSENCRHEPGLYADTPQLVLQRNFTLETYYTVTEDGFILQTFRILPKISTRGLVLLEHSFIANSDMWVDKGDSSLAFLLLDLGYEIWLGNLRGSKFSHHVKYIVDDFEYWDFSFHEQGYYDIKSQVDLIHKVTNNSEIIFIGYSMAGTSAIVYSSVHAEHAKRHVKIFISMGPITYTKNLKGTSSQFANLFINWRLKDVLEFFEFGYIPYGHKLNALKQLFCSIHPFQYVCIWASQDSIGWSKEKFDAALVPIILSKLPDGASLKTLYHGSQQVYSGGKPIMYDYGVSENKKIYNSTKPPLYPLHDIKVPHFVVYGTEDYLCNPQDVEAFYKDLSPEGKKYGKYKVEKYNHFDLMYAKNRHEKIYTRIFKLLRDIET